MTTCAAKSPAELVDPAGEVVPDGKVRKCMMCQTEFTSAWAGERICRKCKSSDKWRRA
jgi:hypothetical protein